MNRMTNFVQSSLCVDRVVIPDEYSTPLSVLPIGCMARLYVNRR